MAKKNPYPLIQGEMCSFANIRASINIEGDIDFETANYAKIDFKDSLEPGDVYGTGPTIIGRTVGQYKAECTLEIYVAMFKFFQQKLKTRRPQGVGVVPFNLDIQFVPLAGGTILDKIFREQEHCHIQVLGCRLKERGGSFSGPDGSTIVAPLSVMKIRMDGVDLI